MKTKHTPGPWLTEGNQVYALHQIGWKKGEPIMSNRFYCGVYGDYKNLGDSVGELNANIKLIAAAPELLEALELIIDAQYNPDKTLANLNSVISSAREIIKKATS